MAASLQHRRASRDKKQCWHLINDENDWKEQRDDCHKGGVQIRPLRGPRTPLAFLWQKTPAAQRHSEPAILLLISTYVGNEVSFVIELALDIILLHLGALLTAKHAYGKGCICCAFSCI